MCSSDLTLESFVQRVPVFPQISIPGILAFSAVPFSPSTACLMPSIIGAKFFGSIGGWGATWAVPIASLMIEKYLKGTITDINKETFIFDLAEPMKKSPLLEGFNINLIDDTTLLEEPISENMLFNANEIWITSSTWEIVPIVKLNDKVFKTDPLKKFSDEIWIPKDVSNNFFNKLNLKIPPLL